MGVQKGPKYADVILEQPLIGPTWTGDLFHTDTILYVSNPSQCLRPALKMSQNILDIFLTWIADFIVNELRIWSGIQVRSGFRIRR